MQPSHLPEWNNSTDKEKKHPQVAAFRFTWLILDQVQITSVSLHKKGEGVGERWEDEAPLMKSIGNLKTHSVNSHKQTGSCDSCTLLCTLKADLTDLSKALITSRTPSKFLWHIQQQFLPSRDDSFFYINTIWMCEWGVSKTRVLLYFLITALMKSSR